nr:MAG TPA: central kinetochore subunit [Caudoviricetes sp.]
MIIFHPSLRKSIRLSFGIVTRFFKITKKGW